MLTLLTNCLYERYQKVVRDGQTSSWELIQCGVPQASVPSPPILLFDIRDTSLFFKVFDKNVSCPTSNQRLRINK